MKHIAKKYVFLSVIIIVLIISGTYFFKFNKKESHPVTYINEVLKSEAYVSLPDKVKTFIMDVYEETGEVIKTSNNKVPNEPYLNPEYEKYIMMSNSEKKELEIIPNTYLTDYEVVDTRLDGATIPASYDIRNVGGKNYITGLKNQGSVGVCWAITTTEIAESHLMIKNNTPGSSQKFSARQLDYALSNNGIENAYNEFGFRTLGSGGNFLLASAALVNGAGLIDENKWPFDASMVKKKYHNVFNQTNSLYEINSTIDVPVLNIANLDLSVEANVTKRDNYLNLIKSHIMTDGGAYVSSQGPTYSCSASNNGSHIIRVDGTCTRDQAHAMQVIGWDDNYSYKYCKSGSKHTAYTSSCSAANTVTGTGAWLLRNSWGTTASYIYLAYDSMDDLFSFITDMSSMSSRSWNYSYHTQITDSDTLYITTAATTFFQRYITAAEKVEKVKFYSYSSNAKYNVIVCDNANKGCQTIEKNVDYPGFVTVDFSSLNIILDDANFAVSVQSTDGSKIVNNSPSVFTSSVSSTPVITTPSAVVTQSGVTIMTFTRNIPDGSTLTFKLFDTAGADKTPYLAVSNSVVALGNVFSYFNISTSLPYGKYVLRTCYGASCSDTDFVYNLAPSSMVSYNANGGSGTVSSDSVNLGNDYVIKANGFTRTGYTFDGWNTAYNGSGTSYASGDTIRNLNYPLTLYAMWKPITYTIKYVPNGGTGSELTQNMTYDVSAISKTPSYTKTGYTFGSWNTKADGTGTKYNAGVSIKNVTSNPGTVMLYAIYEPIKYNVKFDYQFNSLTDTKTVKYNETFTIPENKYYKNNAFLGWNTKANGSGTNYVTGSTFKNLTTTNGTTITLYAIWDTKSLLTVKNYVYNQNEQLIEDVPANTNINNYKSNVIVSSEYTLDAYRNNTKLGTNDIIGTGTIIKVYKSGNLVFSITNVIRGDANGDGKVNSADYVSIRKHIMDTQKISGTAQTKGADANKDSKITSADYIKIKKYIMNGGTF